MFCFVRNKVGLCYDMIRPTTKYFPTTHGTQTFLANMSNMYRFYYAVAVGRKPGIYNTWSECSEQTSGIQNAKFKKFNTREEAEEFIRTVQNSPRNKAPAPAPASSSGRVTNVVSGSNGQLRMDELNSSSNVSVKIENNDCSWTVDSNTVSEKDLKIYKTYGSKNYLLGVTVKEEPGTAPVESKEEVILLETSQSNYTTPPCLKQSVYYPNFKSYEFLKNKKEKKEFTSLTVTEVCSILKGKLDEKSEKPVLKDKVENFEKKNENTANSEVLKKKKKVVNELEKGKKKKENSNLSDTCVRAENNDFADFVMPKKKGKKNNEKDKKVIKLQTGKKSDSDPPVKHLKSEHSKGSPDFEVPKKKKRKIEENGNEIVELETKKKKKMDKVIKINKIEEESGEHDLAKKKIKQCDPTKEKKRKRKRKGRQESIGLRLVQRKKKIREMEKDKKKKRRKKTEYFTQTDSNELSRKNEESSPGLKQIDQILSESIINNHFDVKALVLTAIENLLTNGMLPPQVVRRDLFSQTQQPNLTQDEAAQPGPSTSGLNTSVTSSVSNDIKNESTPNKNDFLKTQCSDSKNVDIVALNLRLDSFEKRFDDCLKQIGGICSEMCNLKGEINKINATLTEHSAQLSEHNGCGTNIGVRSFKHKSMTLQSILNNALKPTQPLRPQPLPGTSRAFSTLQVDYPPDDPSRRKRSKLESDNDLGQPPSQDSLSEEEGEVIKEEAENSLTNLPFIVDEENYVHVYTDGACVNNGKRGAKAGVGVWFGDEHPMNLSLPVDGRQTNNTAEIQAARIAVEIAANAGLTRLKIHTDSDFLINCMTVWITKWRKNEWRTSSGKEVQNREELEKLAHAMSLLTEVVWEKVLGHSGILGNEMADKLANEGAVKHTK